MRSDLQGGVARLHSALSLQTSEPSSGANVIPRRVLILAWLA